MKSIFKNKALTWCLSVTGAVGLTVPFFITQSPAEASVDGRAQFDPADNDGDGMSDAWEVHFFGDVTARDGSEDDDLDDILNVDEWNSGTDPLSLDPRSVGESGIVEAGQADANVWHTVRLDGTYSNPVVIMGPVSSNGGQPLTIRVKSVNANSFEFQFDEYEYLDGWHITERLSWIVIEEGVHVLPSGQKLQAGYVNVAAGGARINFSETFDSLPVVMSQVATYNGSYSTTPLQWDVSESGFNVILRNQENHVRHGMTESTAWMALEKGQGAGVAGAFEVGETGRTVDHTWESLAFSAALPNEPTFLAMMQSKFGGDTANIRYRNLSSAGVQVKVDEEWSRDNEIAHTTENVGYLTATPGMFHVLPTTGDADADGIADAYELANGLVIGEFDFYGDKDGDGITNAEEARLGTRADLTDSDGDNISDFEEVNFLNSNALANDVGTFQLQQTIAGSDYTNPFGDWQAQNGHAQQASVRGSVDYSISPTSSGVYSVEIDLAPYSGADRSKNYEVVISVDGEFVSRESLEMIAGQTGTAKILTPWLNAGSHTVSVFVDNSYTFRKAEIQQVRLLSATGADSDGNGLADWAEIRTQNQNGLARSYAQSKTSPVCLEGKGRFTSLIQSNQALTIQKAPNSTWYGELVLDANAPTSLQLTYENSGLVENESIEWVATNLLQESTLTIRQGDALRLTASASSAGSSLENVSLTVEGNQLTTTANLPLVHHFDNAGTQTIDVVHTDENGVQTNHQVTVNVVSLVNVTSPVCVVGFERPWEVTGLPDEAIVQIGNQVSVFDGERLGTSGYSYTIATQTPESKYAVVRLGFSGPILGSTEIKAVTIKSSDQTGVVYKEDLGGGTYLLNMPVVVSEAHAGVTVRCDIYLAGVMYPDGSQTTDLDATDFDEFGSHTLEFIKPQNAHSNCHRFSLWQDGIRIAYYN